MCRTVHPSIVPNSGRLGATKQLLAWSTQLETESFRLVSFRFGSEHLWLIPRARIQPRINERDRKGRHEMNRSADRLNLCLSELKGAEQLKNFSLFFIIVRSRNDFLSRWKFKKRNYSKFESQFRCWSIVYFPMTILFYLTLEEKECFSKTKVGTKWNGYVEM